MGDNGVQDRIDNGPTEDEHARQGETDWRTNESCSTRSDTKEKAEGYGVEERRTLNHRAAVIIDYGWCDAAAGLCGGLCHCGPSSMLTPSGAAADAGR
ncbi:hypothetical protein MTO96_008319 [Rhipicephalus appendiculatus]